MSEEPFDVQDLVDGLRRGDERASEEFFKRYGASLEGLAGKHLSPGVRRRVGPESIAQSVCRTFLRRAQAGEFDVEDGDALWRLLVSIALTKTREKIRYHFRQKRGLDREQGAPADTSALDAAAHQAVDKTPLPDEQAAFAESFQALIEALDDEEREIVDLRLQGLSQVEIAEHKGCAERTVRRILVRVQDKLEAAFKSA